MTWCSLCFLDLRPQPVGDPTPSDTEDRPGPAEDTDDPAAGVRRGRHARGDVDPDPSGRVDVDAMLAELAASAGTAGVGRLGALLAEPRRRALVVTGAGIGLLVVLVLILSLLGLVVG